MKGWSGTRRFLFLTFGLGRGYPGRRRSSPPGPHDTMVEPPEARACRRNIMILAGGVVLAWAAGAELQNLDLLGITPAGERGVMVLCVAAMLVHVYWYWARYWHLRENSTRTLQRSFQELKGVSAEIDWDGERHESARVYLRVADLSANWVAAGLTVLSWCILAGWALDAHSNGT